MAALARWTNLSETTFLLRANRSRRGLPRAHLHALRRAALRRAPDARLVPRLARGGRKAATPGLVVQQCGVGLVRVRCAGRAWNLRRRPCAVPARSSPTCWRRSPRHSRCQPSDIVHHQWVDNGPGWCAVMLRSATQVHSLKPDWASLNPLKLGVVGPHEPATTRLRVRAFIGEADTKIRSPAA